MATTTRLPAQNRLIAALPVKDRRRFLAGCEPIELVFGTALVEAGERCRYVYFPTASFISLVTTLRDRSRLEVGIVGSEGMVGVSLALDVAESPLHALVQGAGPALRMRATDFHREMERSPILRR